MKPLDVTAAPRPHPGSRQLILATLPPLVALAVQSLFWSLIQPYVWFLFFPAVFLSSQMAGLWTGLYAAVLSTALVWWFFVPSRYELIKEPRQLFPAVVFLGMGVAFSLFHERLRRADRRAAAASEEISRLYQQTRELDRLKTRFFANVSHELRTPLALILGPTERLLGAADTPAPVRRDLEVVARNARTLLGHVDDLLDLARLEAARLNADYAEADLAQLVRLVADHFDVLACERAMTFTVEAPPALPAQVDPDKLRRVLLNLVANAFKFTPVGGTLRLTAREDGERVVLEVADSGPGIPPGMRHVVFERFRQLEDDTTRRLGGTGLGLAIAREFVTLHRGTIRIADAREGGARFVVDLPRLAPPGAVVRPARAMTAPVALAGTQPASPRPAPMAPGDRPVGLVLVVEDNRDMNQFVCDVLAPAHRVAAAFDGAEGLRRTAELRPDLVVTDLMLPELGGDDMIRAIRARPELDRIAVLVLSARADEALLARLLREGAQDCLAKPFGVETLRARVDNLVTHKKYSEAMAHLASLVEQAPDGILIADLGARFTAVNPAACQLLGYSRDELQGMSILDLLRPDDAARLWAYRARLLTGLAETQEWCVRRKDGTYIPVEVNARILPDGRWQSFMRDISERKRVEQALRERQADLDRAQAVAQVGSWLLDLRRDQLHWSDENYRIFGVPIGTPVRYRDFLARVHPDDRDLVDRAWKAAIAGAPYDIEHRVVVGGETRWVRERAELDFDADGTPLRGIGTTQDITTRKRADEALQRLYAHESLQRAWLSTTIDQMPEGVLILDTHGEFVLQNRVALALARRLGRLGTAEERLYDLRYPSGEPVPFADTPPARALRGESVVGVELVIVGPDGRHVPVLASATPVVIDGEPAGVAVVFQDIHTLKELERLREEWTSIVAHDLRQPVTVIGLTVDALLRDRRAQRSEREQRALERMAHTCQRLARMIGDLLDASRIEARRLTIQPCDVDLAALAVSVVEQAGGAVEGCPIRVVTDGPQPSRVDPDRIQQVLDNLLTNAAKYGEPGAEIQVEVATRDGAVELAVTNRGPGISPEQMPLLFNRFTRTREARENRRPGLGLGLYIARGIVEAHGGRIWAESTPGATTCFRCLLPRPGPGSTCPKGQP